MKLKHIGPYKLSAKREPGGIILFIAIRTDGTCRSARFPAVMLKFPERMLAETIDGRSY